MTDPTRKHILSFRVNPEMYAAIREMGLACGMTSATSADRFAAELLEVAVVEAYAERFQKRIAGQVISDDVPDPEPEEEEDE